MKRKFKQGGSTIPPISIVQTTISDLRRVWRYQRGNQNPYMKKNNVQKKKYKSTNNDLQNIQIKLKIE